MPDHPEHDDTPLICPYAERGEPSHVSSITVFPVIITGNPVTTDDSCYTFDSDYAVDSEWWHMFGDDWRADPHDWNDDIDDVRADADEYFYGRFTRDE